MNIQKTSRAEAMKPCAVCLHRVGFGVKIVNRLTGIPLTTLKRLRVKHGLNKLPRRKSANWFRFGGASRTRDKVHAAQLWQFKREQRALRRGDEQRHWGNHNAIKCWYSKLNYDPKAAMDKWRDYEKRMPEPVRQRKLIRHRDWKRKQIKTISPHYAAEVLSAGTSLRPKDFPPELVEIKQLQLQLKRENEDNKRRQGNTTIQELREKKVTPAHANAVANLTGKWVSTVKVELEYAKLTNGKPNGKFLQLNNAKVKR